MSIKSFTEAYSAILEEKSAEELRVILTGMANEVYHTSRQEFTKKPLGYTWHHHHDGKSMHLVPRDLHDAVKHTGGVATIRKMDR